MRVVNTLIDPHLIAINLTKAHVSLACGGKAPCRSLAEGNENEVDKNEETSQSIKLFAVLLGKVLVVHAIASIA